MENNNTFTPLTNQQAAEILKGFHKEIPYPRNDNKSFMRFCLDEAFMKAIDLLAKTPDNPIKECDNIE